MDATAAQVVIASDSEATQTKPHLETLSLGRFALLAITVAKIHPAAPSQGPSSRVRAASPRGAWVAAMIRP
ncbi:MAG: hypothetical protein WAV18_31650, partial [Roseiarcus sp.]